MDEPSPDFWFRIWNNYRIHEIIETEYSNKELAEDLAEHVNYIAQKAGVNYHYKVVPAYGGWYRIDYE